MLLSDVLRDGWRDHAVEPFEVAERPAAHVHLIESAEAASLAKLSARELCKLPG